MVAVDPGRRALLLGAAALACGLPLAAAPSGAARLTLLHTNDTHSQIEPFGPGPFQGKGGIARRATLVRQLRQELGGTLLLDAGDVFQGTPYFNRYKGVLDYQLMSMMGYDAGTLGNHDFDNGVEGLLTAMAQARFPFVNCHLDARGAPGLGERLRPYLVRELPGVKVGITGACVDFAGLVAPANHQGVDWRDPVAPLKAVVERLRRVERVDLVVLLSHLGYDMRGEALDDLHLPGLVPGIDVIIGGHTHTFLDAPVRVANDQGGTLVFQVGFGGIQLGRMDFTFGGGRLLASSGGTLPVLA
jgi:5'-nucleotidase